MESIIIRLRIIFLIYLIKLTYATDEQQNDRQTMMINLFDQVDNDDKMTEQSQNEPSDSHSPIFEFSKMSAIFQEKRRKIASTTTSMTDTELYDVSSSTTNDYTTNNDDETTVSHHDQTSSHIDMMSKTTTTTTDTELYDISSTTSDYTTNNDDDQTSNDMDVTTIRYMSTSSYYSNQTSTVDTVNNTDRVDVDTIDNDRFVEKNNRTDSNEEKEDNVVKQSEINRTKTPFTTTADESIEITTSGRRKFMVTSTTTKKTPQILITTTIETQKVKTNATTSTTTAKVGLTTNKALLKLPILWIDSSYKAWDYGINLTELSECVHWRQYWTGNVSNNDDDDDSNIPTESVINNKRAPIEKELIEDTDRAAELGIDETLLVQYEKIGISYMEICADHARILLFNNSTQAKQLGIDEKSPICAPFKLELTPNVETLKNFTIRLLELVDNSSHSIDISVGTNHSKRLNIRPQRSVPTVVGKNKEATTTRDVKWRNEVLLTEVDDEDDTINTNIGDITNENNTDSNVIYRRDGIEMSAADSSGTAPVLTIETFDAARAIGLHHIDESSFRRHQKVALYLPGICADYVPKAIESFNKSDFEGVEILGPIGINASALEAAGVNLTELAEKLRNDTEVDDILLRTNLTTARTLGGSYIVPVLDRIEYDRFSAPIVFQGSAVVVRFGIYIESISNFQASTMDYDMDIYLIMAWRDVRLSNPYGRPILVKEAEILDKIWRPDPFFSNAKEAEFHAVTFLNFLMRVFSDGLVLYETRIKLKPSCNLVLCKYPHDRQTCELVIKSFAYPLDTVRFEWFSSKSNAIDKNPDVNLPELYIAQYIPTVCNPSRKSGIFACLRAVFHLKRDVGFHIAQTYIPTALALMFSWVGVWLPQEFMEGRIILPITVLLTLSTESSGANEHLPSVSYIKAIDLWFGFITGFVFLTLLQTLIVIGFEKRANQLRKWSEKKRTDLSANAREQLVYTAHRYHKTARCLDNFCRVCYPLSFVLFLFSYYFVFTEGMQDDCISR